MRKVTLGGKRLGAGNKNQVELKSYERSTHNLSYVNRFTAAPGTVIPFMSRVAQPGDTWDIGLSCEILTHPTVGPLFGSFKGQLDILVAAVRLYQGELHMNKAKIGLNMSAVKLPMVQFSVTEIDSATTKDLDNSQVNPSALIALLGYRGFGMTTDADVTRLLCAIPILMYYDCIKQYYCNLQEEIGVVVHTPNAALITTVDTITVAGNALAQAPVTDSINVGYNDDIIVNYLVTPIIPEQIMFLLNGNRLVSLADLVYNVNHDTGGTNFNGRFNVARWGVSQFINWNYISATELNPNVPGLATFPLENIDTMRSNILAAALTGGTAFKINTPALTPYSYTYGSENGRNFSLGNQEGLCVKTYLSDLFNAWLNTDWIDGVGGISEITAVSTAGNEFTVDALVMAKKVWEVLNRIAVSDGSYYGWQEAVYDEEPFVKSETPMYMGGMIRELVFQEVISNSGSETQEGSMQPLGTIGGRGTMAKGKKGGRVRVKVSEMSHIMGLFSLTPRIDYSQGNNWDIYLETMDDYHKPGLDQIGFQELLQRRMAWWASSYVGGNWVERSAGKQPAWIEYRTAVNEVHGNFAISTNEMFMVLTRRYEYNLGGLEIDDMTTYIDPQKFNNIFAQTDLAAQNFWVNIGVDCEVRRKMSHAVMPNL